MKISWSHGAHVACFGKIFNDGWGAIIWMKWQKNCMQTEAISVVCIKVRAA